MGLCRQGCRPVLWLFVLRWRWLEGGAGSKICNWSQSFSSEHSGADTIPDLAFCMPGSHGAAGSCLWLGSWSRGMGNARGTTGWHPAPRVSTAGVDYTYIAEIRLFSLNF